LSTENETLACIKKDKIKYLQSGQISKYIFPMERKKAHKEKIPHLIIRVFIITKTKEGDILFLVQKRSKDKKSYPGYFTDSASGHVQYQENLNLDIIKANALRELKEEFGIHSKEIQNLTFYDLNSEEDKFIKEVAYIFLGIVDPMVELNPNPEELEPNESKFYTRKELLSLLKKDNLVDYSKEVWNELLDTNLEDFFPVKQKSQKERKIQEIALFIGRFQPLHHGHIHVIYRIFESHAYLKIGIGSSQISHIKVNPFTKEERKQFIRAALEKRAIPESKYSIYYIPDIFNASKWVDHVVSIIGDFDIIFSNSDWVRELFKNKGYNLSRKITIFKNKYNGTHIRNLINQDDKQWRSLVPNEVIRKIEQFNGIKRIKKLYKENEEKE
jgi:nicotinamide-nucleotide adenylyltransferase